MRRKGGWEVGGGGEGRTVGNEIRKISGDGNEEAGV